MNTPRSFAGRLPPRWRQSGDVLVGVALTIAISLAVAQLPVHVAGGGLDSSWGSVLRYAYEHGLRFGNDIVFTFGPLGAAATAGFSGGSHVGPTRAGAVITLLFVLPMVLVARRLPWRQALGMLVLVGALPLMRACGLDGFVHAALLCWGILAFTTPMSPSRAPGVLAAMCAGLAAFVAVIGLTKFSWFVAGMGTVAAVTADLWLRGRAAGAALLVVTSVGLWIAGWLALGQSPGDIPAFVGGSLEIAVGYAKAMGTRGRAAVLVLALLAVGSCAAGVVVRGRNAALPGDQHLQVRRWLLMLWLLGMLFIGWKHGMGRAAVGDTHVTGLVCQCVVLAFALSLIPVSAADVDRLASVRGWGVAVLALVLGHWMQLGSLEDGVALSLARISTNARTLAKPEKHQRWLEETWAQARESLSLPEARGLIGDDEVDVFGHRQDHAIATGLNYVPRPVFQSYSVYTKRLAELNDRFYQSPRAPAWVLFELGSIDGRYPGLEDALALRTILHDYRIRGTDHQFLVLHRERHEPIRLEVLARGTARIGERIDVSEHRDRDLWLEVDAVPGILTRLEAFVLRPPPLRLRVWADGFPAEGYAYNSPASMLATGFIASPVLGETADASALLTGAPTRRLQGFALETSDRSRDTRIHYRLQAIAGGLVVGK